MTTPSPAADCAKAVRAAVPVTEIVAALEREAANTDTDPRWVAASELRRMTGWESRTLICTLDDRPSTAAGLRIEAEGQVDDDVTGRIREICWGAPEGPLGDGPVPRVKPPATPQDSPQQQEIAEIAKRRTRVLAQHEYPHWFVKVWFINQQDAMAFEAAISTAALRQPRQVSAEAETEVAELPHMLRMMLDKARRWKAGEVGQLAESVANEFADYVICFSEALHTAERERDEERRECRKYMADAADWRLCAQAADARAKDAIIECYAIARERMLADPSPSNEAHDMGRFMLEALERRFPVVLGDLKDDKARPSSLAIADARAMGLEEAAWTLWNILDEHDLVDKLPGVDERIAKAKTLLAPAADKEETGNG